MNSSTFNDAEYLNHQVKFENDENTDMHGTNETMSEQKTIRVLKWFGIQILIHMFCTVFLLVN